jgi:hypothetical protein
VDVADTTPRRATLASADSGANNNPSVRGARVPTVKFSIGSPGHVTPTRESGQTHFVPTPIKRPPLLSDRERERSERERDRLLHNQQASVGKLAGSRIRAMGGDEGGIMPRDLSAELDLMDLGKHDQGDDCDGSAAQQHARVGRITVSDDSSGSVDAMRPDGSETKARKTLSDSFSSEIQRSAQETTPTSARRRRSTDLVSGKWERAMVSSPNASPRGDIVAAAVQPTVQPTAQRSGRQTMWVSSTASDNFITELSGSNSGPLGVPPSSDDEPPVTFTAGIRSGSGIRHAFLSRNRVPTATAKVTATSSPPTVASSDGPTGTTARLQDDAVVANSTADARSGTRPQAQTAVFELQEGYPPPTFAALILADRTGYVVHTLHSTWLEGLLRLMCELTRLVMDGTDLYQRQRTERPIPSPTATVLPSQSQVCASPV